MSLRTPIVVAVALLSALGGVALAAVALLSSPPRPTAAPAPEVRTETVRRTIHVVRREKSATPTPSTDDSAQRLSRATDDHHGSRGRGGDDDGVGARAADDSGHHRHGRGDDDD
jgi:hypothetical protein